MSHNRRAVRVVIRGRVQGIGFRAWTQHQAELHGLAGWVRNLADGSVEAAFAGPDDAVEAMLKAVRRGPQGSEVVEVVESEAADLEDASAFVIRDTR
jgi:acylphosphatase